MINRVLSPGSQQRRPQLGPGPGHLHLLLIELCIQDHLCKATTWGMGSFGILVGAFRFQIPHIFSQIFVQRMNLKSPQSSLDGCGFPSLFVGVGFFPTPTVQVTTLPAFQGVMDRLQEVISQELNGFPIILAVPKPAVFDLPFTCQTMKHATTCHHLPKHHPHISSHSRQRPLSTPQRRWDGLAPGKTHMLGAHIQREVGFSKNLKWATSPPATKLEFYREPSAITFWKSTHVSSKPLLRKEDVLFNFLLLLSFQVPISMELFNIKPFLKNARHSAFVTKISNHWRSIRFHPGTKDLCHTTSGLRKNDIQLLQHAVNSSVVPGLPVLYQMHWSNIIQWQRCH